VAFLLIRYGELPSRGTNVKKKNRESRQAPQPECPESPIQLISHSFSPRHSTPIAPMSLSQPSLRSPPSPPLTNKNIKRKKNNPAAHLQTRLTLILTTHTWTHEHATQTCTSPVLTTTSFPVSVRHHSCRLSFPYLPLSRLLRRLKCTSQTHELKKKKGHRDQSEVRKQSCCCQSPKV